MMGKKETPSRTSSEQLDISTLHKRAEEQAATLNPSASKVLTPDEAQQMLHDLRVHQIELELQNEELRRVQQELDAARERYFDLYDMAPVGYITLSEQGLILEANLTFAGLLGVGRGVLVKQPLSRFILREDQDIYYQHRKQLFENGEAQICDLRMVKKDGTRFWAHVAGTAAQDKKGLPVCRTMISDISGRKQAEEALRESERFLASTLDGLSSHIAVIDASGEIVLTNKAYREFASQNGGDPRAVSEGANYIAICDAAQGEGSLEAAPFGEAIRRVLAGSCLSFELEYPCHSPDRKRWFIGRVTPFRGDGPRRAVVAHEDITERKKAELAIQDLSRHLMTIQEEERQRVARDLHDSVGQTVLAAKLNIEAYLKNKCDGERLGNGLAFLDRASQELRSIYNGLYPSILDDLGFEAAVRWYARHILEANGISVSLDIALESQINPDTAVNLYRIVQEILSNVLKHSGSDSVRLHVHEKEGMITLTVQDKGIGFDETKPGVDRFGLVSLRYRAKLLGGECRIDSKADEGTTVTVTAMREAP